MGEGEGDGKRVEGPTPQEVEGLVRSLIGMMRGGGMTELDLAFGGVSIRLRGSPTAFATDAGAPVMLPDGPGLPVEPPGHLLTAPMIGTFYAAPSPGAPAFVAVGDAVAAGQTIGIIEAMKIMNEIPAERAGVVEEILVANGQPVEFGTPLLRLRPTPAVQP